MRNVLFIIATCASLAACATVEGVGQDISSGARAVSNW
ncbi:entericidin EcnA/B family protein [Falsihalocynthiibacter sp. SS001]